MMTADEIMAAAHGRAPAPAAPMPLFPRLRRPAPRVGALSMDDARQRIDYQWLPDGRVRAVVTVTLPNGQVYRYSGTASADDLPAEAFEPRTEVGRTSTDKVADPYHRLRVSYLYQHGTLAGTSKAQRWWNAIGKDRRGDFKRWYATMVDQMGAPLHSDRWHSHIRQWKKLNRRERGRLMTPYTKSTLDKIGDAVKDVASSKAFRWAAKGLALAAPVLGPLAPVALGASAAMGTASSLVAAHGAEAVGALKTAGDLVGLAKREAKALAPKNASKLLRVANDKAKRATGRKPGKSRASKRRALARLQKRAAKNRARVQRKLKARVVKRLPAKSRPAKSAAVLAAAKRGRVKSTKGGRVTASQLLAAAKKGRVFVVS